MTDNSCCSCGPPAFVSTVRRSPLARHLTVIIIIKIILLALLWHTFIKPNKVEVDMATMGERIAGPQASQFQPVTVSPGENK